MSDEKGYNGWTNYETWLVALWLDNEQGSYDYWREAALEAYRSPAENRYMDPDARRRLTLVERLRTEIKDEGIPDELSSGLYSDLLNAALSEVDWYDLARHYLDEIQDEADEADEVEE